MSTSKSETIASQDGAIGSGRNSFSLSYIMSMAKQQKEGEEQVKKKEKEEREKVKEERKKERNKTKRKQLREKIRQRRTAETNDTTTTTQGRSATMFIPSVLLKKKS